MQNHGSLDLTYTKYIKPHHFTPSLHIQYSSFAYLPKTLSFTHICMHSLHPRKPTRLGSQIQRNTFGKTLRINNNEYCMRLFAYVREGESFKHLLTIIPTLFSLGWVRLKYFELKRTDWCVCEDVQFLQIRSIKIQDISRCQCTFWTAITRKLCLKNAILKKIFGTVFRRN